MDYVIDYPKFQDVYLLAEAIDPVDFNMVATFSDKIKDLGLGQVNAPEIVNMDVILNVDVVEEGLGIAENYSHGRVVFYDGQTKFEGDNPVLDVD